MRNNTIAFFILQALILLAFAGSAFAHRVSVFAYSDGNTVHVEGHFADGTGCKDCAVEAYDKGTGKKLAGGRTDHEGMFSFPAPPAGTVQAVKIVLDSGSGHGGEFLLALGGGVAPPLLPGELEEALDRKVSPLVAEVRRLRQAHERPGFTEILGGIGYIVGLAGLAAYLASRKKGKG